MGQVRTAGFQAFCPSLNFAPLPVLGELRDTHSPQSKPRSASMCPSSAPHEVPPPAFRLNTVCRKEGSVAGSGEVSRLPALPWSCHQPSGHPGSPLPSATPATGPWPQRNIHSLRPGMQAGRSQP